LCGRHPGLWLPPWPQLLPNGLRLSFFHPCPCRGVCRALPPRQRAWMPRQGEIRPLALNTYACRGTWRSPWCRNGRAGDGRGFGVFRDSRHRRGPPAPTAVFQLASGVKTLHRRARWRLWWTSQSSWPGRQPEWWNCYRTSPARTPYAGQLGERPRLPEPPRRFSGLLFGDLFDLSATSPADVLRRIRYGEASQRFPRPSLPIQHRLFSLCRRTGGQRPAAAPSPISRRQLIFQPAA